MRYVIIFCLLLFVAGCSSVSETWIRNHDSGEMELVYRHKSTGSHVHEYTSPKGHVIKTDSKQPSLLDGFSIIKAGV